MIQSIPSSYGTVCSSYSFTVGLTSLSLQTRGQNIVVTNVCPGPVQTMVDINAVTSDGSKCNTKEPLISAGMTATRYQLHAPNLELYTCISTPLINSSHI